MPVSGSTARRLTLVDEGLKIDVLDALTINVVENSAVQQRNIFQTLAAEPAAAADENDVSNYPHHSVY